MRPSDTTQYTIGDSITHASATSFALTGVAGHNGETVIVDSVIVKSSTKEATLPVFNLWLFNTNVSISADNAALAITDVENTNVLTVIPLSQQFYTANNSRLEAHNLNRLIQVGSGTTSIWGALEAGNAYTPVASETFSVEIKGHRV